MTSGARVGQWRAVAGDRLPVLEALPLSRFGCLPLRQPAAPAACRSGACCLPLRRMLRR